MRGEHSQVPRAGRMPSDVKRAAVATRPFATAPRRLRLPGGGCKPGGRQIRNPKRTSPVGSGFASPGSDTSWWQALKDPPTKAGWRPVGGSFRARHHLVIEPLGCSANLNQSDTYDSKFEIRNSKFFCVLSVPLWFFGWVVGGYAATRAPMAAPRSVNRSISGGAPTLTGSAPTPTPRDT